MTVKPRWLILLAYPTSGLVLGLADPLLGPFARQLGARPGVATAASVNLLLPLLAVALAILHARLLSVWVGAVSMTVGLIVGLAAGYHRGPWSPGDIPPVLVVAGIGYGILGTIAALVTRADGLARPRGTP
jgi:hypothetical protein